VIEELTEDQLGLVRDVVADAMTSGARYLDRGHVVLRTGRSRRVHMLGEIEVEVFAQFFLRRFFSRDRRAEQISRRLSGELGHDCATWINLSVVGYSRVTSDGRAYFSD